MGNRRILCRLDLLLRRSRRFVQRIHLALELVQLGLLARHLAAVFHNLLVRLPVNSLRIRRPDQKPHNQCAKHQPNTDIQHRCRCRRLAERRRNNHRIPAYHTLTLVLALLLRALPAAEPPRLQRRLRTRLEINLLQETKRRRVRLVNFRRLFQNLPRFLILTFVNINQRQQMISLDQLRILVQNLAQLDRSHILIVLAAAFQRTVVFLDRLIDHIQLRLLRLQRRNILRRHIILRHNILADDPLT